MPNIQRKLTKKIKETATTTVLTKRKERNNEIKQKQHAIC